MITDIVSFDGHAINDGTNYVTGFVAGSEPRLPSVEIETLERIGAWPVIVAIQRKKHSVALLIRITGSSRNTLRTQLFQWFDPEDEAPKVLVAENHDGVQVYVEALCSDFQVYGDQQHDTVFVATLVVHGDVRWRAVTASTATWNVTASGQTTTVANSGEDEAYPVLTIKPTSAKAGGYLYKRRALVTWRGLAATNYATRLAALDTATLVTASKMQADGDDLRVFVDGVEVPRYLVAMNDAATYIWFVCNWAEARSATLEVSIADSGDIDSIEMSSVAGFPASGAVRIDNEVLLYTGRDDVLNELTGITRGGWGTSLGAHSAAAAVYWMQHEVVVVYGNAAATAPAYSAAKEPVITLASSTNVSWVYDVFGDLSYPTRPGSWTPDYKPVSPDVLQWWGSYSATEKTYASPYTVAGLWILYGRESSVYGVSVRWQLSHPCGIVNAAWSGKKYKYADGQWNAPRLTYYPRGGPYWLTQATIAEPSAATTWEAWSVSAAVSDWSAADIIELMLWEYRSMIEVETVTVSLSASYTPVVAALGSEETNYTSAMVLTNTTTGDAITIAFEGALDQELEIDTEQKTVTYLADDSNQFQALTLNSARRAWLRLVVGNNVLRLDDAGTAGVTVGVTFKRRYY